MGVVTSRVTICEMCGVLAVCWRERGLWVCVAHRDAARVEAA